MVLKSQISLIKLFLIKEGVLYLILYKLEQSGFISSSKQIMNRKLRVYYHLTELGQEELTMMELDFQKKAEVIQSVLKNGGNYEK